MTDRVKRDNFLDYVPFQIGRPVMATLVVDVPDDPSMLAAPPTKMIKLTN